MGTFINTGIYNVYLYYHIQMEFINLCEFINNKKFPWQGVVPVLSTLLCLAVDLLFFGDAALQSRRDLNLTMFDWTVSYYGTDG